MQEIFAKLLKIVSEVTEVPPDMIMSRDRHEEVVDARCLLVYLLSQQGLYPSAIARYTRLSVRTINLMISTFSERLYSRRILVVNLKKSQQKLGND